MNMTAYFFRVQTTVELIMPASYGIAAVIKVCNNTRGYNRYYRLVVTLAIIYPWYLELVN